MAVWAAATAAAALVARPVAPVAGSGWSAAEHGDLAGFPFDQALVSLASTVLLLCLAWAWLAVSVVVAEAALGGDGSRAFAPSRPGPWRVPVAVRRAVLAACGIALVGAVSPAALADTHGYPGHRHGIAGLPLPDRATAAPQLLPPAPRSAPTVVVVAAGDSLWSISMDHLPRGSSDARVTRRWHALYAANRTVIGPDPDHLEPGQRLRLPHQDKDLP